MMPGSASACTPAPTVSVVIATYNSARFLGPALLSARRQTLGAIEIIVVDDASSDDSVRIARAQAAEDARILVIPMATNGGPAAARNRALEAARGEWIAILDSDDLMHPDRLRRLLDAAIAGSADIVADDMLSFDDDAATPPRALLPANPPATPPAWVDLESYVRANVLYGRTLALGYLKPMIRAAALQGLRYDETLRIGEDYDLVARLLQQGARFRIVPELTYFYRRHGASISHRLSRSTIVPMQRAHDRFCAATPAPSAALAAALHARARSLGVALAFDTAIAALKARDWPAVAAALLHEPAAIPLLRLPLLARLRRLLPAPRPNPASAAPRIVLLSRQRLTGAVNGSSAYLLSLVQSLADTGLPVHLVQPSPAVFGRWPVLVLRPEMAVFSSIRVRGGLAIGRTIVATDPRIAVRAALTILDRAKLRLGSTHRMQPAPYAVAVPWTRADRLFVATHAAGADAALADYAFLTEGLPYTLRPEAASAVVMHDLFSSRAAQFSGTSGMADSVATLDLAAEMAMLGQADAIIAIQADEAAIVQHHLPGRTVLTAPMAIRPVDTAQPGHDNQLLFVGSNTAPNTVGLRWFLGAVWPAVAAACPGAVLKVAGGVGDAFAHGTCPGVEFLGRVSNLGPLYRDAGIVISPLLQGSGLKVKLIEALGHGKAIVATSRTVQGVEALLGGIIPITDDPATFAAEILLLIHDPALRSQRADAALTVAREAFTAARCYETAGAYLTTAIRTHRDRGPNAADLGNLPAANVHDASRSSGQGQAAIALAPT